MEAIIFIMNLDFNHTDIEKKHILLIQPLNPGTFVDMSVNPMAAVIMVTPHQTGTVIQ